MRILTFQTVVEESENESNQTEPGGRDGKETCEDKGMQREDRCREKNKVSLSSAL